MGKMLKYILLGVLIGTMLFSQIGYATGSNERIKVQFLPLKYIFEGVEATPPAGQSGFLYNGTTYVPLRFVAEALGKDVTWEGSTYSIFVASKQTEVAQRNVNADETSSKSDLDVRTEEIEVQFVPLNYYFEGEEATPPAGQSGFLYNGTTYVPLRFVAEALGKEVEWEGSTYSIIVTTNLEKEQDPDLRIEPDEDDILYDYRYSGMFGWIDQYGHVVLKPKYDGAYSFTDGMGMVSIRKESGIKFGFVNNKGEEVVPPIYDLAHKFSYGYAAVKKDNKWGYVNKKGEVIVEPKYVLVFPFNESGFAQVGVENNKGLPKMGLINQKGEEVVEPKYNFVYPFSEEGGLIKVTNFGENTGYINKQGQFVLDTRFLSFSGNFHEGLAVAVTKDERVGYINTKGNFTILPKYNNALGFNHGIAAVYRKGIEKWGVINKQGEVVIDYKFDDVKYIEEVKEGRDSKLSDLIAVKVEGEWGVIDDQGKYVLNPILDKAPEEVSEGLIGIEIDGKFGFMDINGDIIVETQYEDVSRFNKGLALVKMNNQYGYINNKGQVVIPITFDYASLFKGELAWVKIDEDTSGYINRNGKVIFSY